MKAKFAPAVVPKNTPMHDVSKKVHVTFGDDDNDIAMAIKKRHHPAHDHPPAVKKAKLGAVKSGGNHTPKSTDNVTPKKTAHTMSTESTTKHTPKIISNNIPKKPSPQSQDKSSEQEDILAKVKAMRAKKKMRRQAKKMVDGVKVAIPILKMEPSKLKGPIRVKDIGQFATYCLCEASNPEFATVVNRSLIQNVVLVYAEGLDIKYFGAPENRQDVPKYVDLAGLDREKDVGKATMPFLTSHFTHMVVNKASGDKGRFRHPVSEILQSNVSNSQKAMREEEHNKRLSQCGSNRKAYYTMTLKQLQKANYPIPRFLDPSSTLPDDWKETRPAAGEELQEKRLVAVDCEMVETASGDALARVTLVDEVGEKLLDEFVKPEEPILDYRTQFSGITPEIMEVATCSLRRAQKHVRKLVDHNVILVGHGLDNDLKALKLAHPYCVDTSLLFDHFLGPPYKPPLKGLAQRKLGLSIQKSSHDSAEDARAALGLFKLKLGQRTPSLPRSQLELELIFDRLAQYNPPRTGVILESNIAANHMFGSTLGSGYMRYDTDDELVDKITEQAKTTNFIFSRFRSLEQKETGSDVPVVVSSASKCDSDMATRLSRFDAYLKRLHNGLPAGSVIIVMGGPVKTSKYVSLLDKYQTVQEMKRQGMSVSQLEKDGVWSETETRRLYGEAAKVRLGSTFFTIKQL